MAGADLLDPVRAVLRASLDVYDVGPATERVHAALARLDEPLRVALAGRVKAGKSTLLNALVGERVAATDAAECTKVVTWFTDGVTYRAWLDPVDGGSRQVPFTRKGGHTEIDLQGTPLEGIERLRVEFPSQQLRELTLIDTPGIASLSERVAARTHDLLTPGDDEGGSDADAVVYLMRHLHASDVRFLEAFHDDQFGWASPVNTIAVLSRADEIGPGRTDSVDLAADIAQRYEQDPRVQRLAQRVLPVAGLLAQAATTVGEADYRALAALAAEPVEVTDRLLLSTDRFVHTSVSAGVDRQLRWGLLERLGLFGIRFALALLHHRLVSSADELARALVSVSGLAELRHVLLSHFAARSDALRAKSGLDLLERVIEAHPAAGTDRLSREIERIRANAHELAEIQLLDNLRTSDRVGVPPELAREMERLLGGWGTEAAHRLDLSEDAEPDELRAAALEKVGRWARYRELPTSSLALRRAAMVVIRSCEQILAVTDDRSDRSEPSGSWQAF